MAIEIYEYSIGTKVRRSIEPFLAENEKEGKRHVKVMFSLKSPIDEINLSYSSVKPDVKGTLELINDNPSLINSYNPEYIQKLIEDGNDQLQKLLNAPE